MKYGTAAASAIVLVGVSCSSGPPVHTYVLAAPLDANASSSVNVGSSPRVQLQPVLLPDYLDSTDLKTRAGEHELSASPTGKWSERLSKGITHFLGAALIVRLPTESLTLDPAVDSSNTQIMIDIDSFDVWRDGRCVLSASWKISHGKLAAIENTGRATFTRRATSDKNSLSDDTVVLAMSDLLARLADSVALTVKSSH